MVCVCVCVHSQVIVHTYISLLYLWRGSRSNDIPLAMSQPSNHIFLECNTIPQRRESRLLGEISDFLAR